MKKWRVMVYTLCFCGLCICDQRVESCTGLDGWLKTFENLPVLLMTVMLLIKCRIKEVIKWKAPYLIWTACAVPGACVAVWKGTENILFLNAGIVTALNIIVLGYAVIYTFIHIVLENNKPQLNPKVTAVWFAMLLFMIVSKNDLTWPIYYFVMFGCFYLTAYDEQEEKELFAGMLNGIILGFFVLQGMAIICRPYDRVRYAGIYRNPNRNGLFYLEVLAAVLVKLMETFKQEKRTWERAFYWLGTGVLLAFIFMTVGRTAWAAAVLLVFLFLWGTKKIVPKQCIWKKGLLVLLCTACMLPVCFSMIRYVPAVLHHPIYFWGDWSPNKVHADDPWNSEKYIEWDELWDGAVGRLIKSVEDMLQNSPLAIRVNAAELEPLLTDGEGADGVLVRKTIYKTYFNRLNWRGHTEEEMRFRLTQYYEVPHAHNIYLQFGMEFGIPVMILFSCLMIYSLVRYKQEVTKYGSMESMTYLLYLAIPAAFGLLEYAWGVGSVSLFMMFWSWRGVMWKKSEKQ